MKKKILFTIALAILVCALALCVAAEDYYASNKDEFVSAINKIGASEEAHTIYLNGTDYKGSQYNIQGKNVTIVLQNDVLFDQRILYSVENGNLYVNLNNFKMENGSSRGGSAGTMFYSNCATSTVEVVNGTIKIQDVCYWIDNGYYKSTNVTINSWEEVVWNDQNATSVAKMYFENCSLTSGSCAAIYLNGVKNGCKSQNGIYYYINDCTISGKSASIIHCPTQDSVINDITVTRGDFNIDSWHTHGEKMGTLKVTNSDFTAVSLNLYTSFTAIEVENCKLNRIHANGDQYGVGTFAFIDCTYKTVSVKNDKKGTTTIYEIINPTCTTKGAKYAHTVDNNNANKIFVEEYEKLPHILAAIDSVSYPSGYNKVGIYTGDCTVCNGKGVEAPAPLLIEWLGFSTPQNGEITIVSSYKVNKEAVAILEEKTGIVLSYGVVASVSEFLGDKLPLDENGNEAALENSVVIKAAVTTEFQSYDFRLTDIDGYEDVGLVISSYIMAKEENKAPVISYCGNGENGLKAITYSEL